MSKGPGKWQRIILTKLKSVDYFYLVDLLPGGYSLSQYQALRRAAVTLFEARKVDWWGYKFGSKKILITQHGHGLPDKRPAYHILSV